MVLSWVCEHQKWGRHVSFLVNIQAHLLRPKKYWEFIAVVTNEVVDPNNSATQPILLSAHIPCTFHI